MNMTSELGAGFVTTTTTSDHPPPPPSRRHHDDSSVSPTAAGHRIRLMCSFGGRILPRPHDHQLRYVGGDTRIVAIPRFASFSTLLSKLSKISGSSVPVDQLSVKYQLPNEDLEALISLTSDEDVENMMDEYDRLFSSRTPRLRLFLFNNAADSSGAFGSILDRSGGSKRDDWFFDALNGSGATPPSLLERGRSEASSIISEVPDYLFGLDNNSDETPPAGARQMSLGLENLSLSEPAITKPGQKLDDDIPVEPQVQCQTSYVPNPGWQFVPEPMPVYYVPGPMMPAGSIPVQQVQMPMPMPMPFQFVSHQASGGGQAPGGYGQPVQGVVGNPIHGGPVYVGGTQMVGAPYEYPVPGEAYEFVTSGGLMRNPTAMPLYQPAGIAPAGAELAMPGGSEFRLPRTSQ
ncbi:uncharacterized protein LOC110110857 [Dendrobium catenatum]|uniref:PB1 domain-containing protein n=1 Tax=Dendrobium catenatum TaxID=906689 RepID=A0A2I0WRY0_9ASPA|nr:uncharacterized protein LOC110110857 [Dendrobium catenatum]PKU78420.1 hypothetical protein MA16_Dca019352 [Dendrobium catenatum]